MWKGFVQSRARFARVVAVPVLHVCIQSSYTLAEDQSPSAHHSVSRVTQKCHRRGIAELLNAQKDPVAPRQWIDHWIVLR